jgi:hypothetical protein
MARFYDIVTGVLGQRIAKLCAVPRMKWAMGMGGQQLAHAGSLTRYDLNYGPVTDAFSY